MFQLECWSTCCCVNKELWGSAGVWKFLLWQSCQWCDCNPMQECEDWWVPQTYHTQWQVGHFYPTQGLKVIPFLWMLHPQQMKSYWIPGRALCIVISYWQLQQGGSWWSCTGGKPTELQQECHVAPQWGPSGSYRIFCLRCTHFYSPDLCRLHPTPMATQTAHLQFNGDCSTVILFVDIWIHRIHFIAAHLFSWSPETPKRTRVQKILTHHVVIWEFKLDTVDSTLLQCCANLKLLLSAFLFHGCVSVTTKHGLYSLKKSSSLEAKLKSVNWILLSFTCLTQRSNWLLVVCICTLNRKLCDTLFSERNANSKQSIVCLGCHQIHNVSTIVHNINM